MCRKPWFSELLPLKVSWPECSFRHNESEDTDFVTVLIISFKLQVFPNTILFAARLFSIFLFICQKKKKKINASCKYRMVLEMPVFQASLG